MVAKGVKSVTQTTKSGKFSTDYQTRRGKINMKNPRSETSHSLKIRDNSNEVSRKFAILIYISRD